MSLKLNRSLSLHEERKTTFNSQQPRLLLTVLTRRDLKWLLAKIWQYTKKWFFGVNEVTSLWTYNLSRYFLIHKSVKLIG